MLAVVVDTTGGRLLSTTLIARGALSPASVGDRDIADDDVPGCGELCGDSCDEGDGLSVKLSTFAVRSEYSITVDCDVGKYASSIAVSSELNAVPAGSIG